MRPLALALGATLTLTALVACDPPGKPKVENRWVAPLKVTDFAKLYRENCLACHSDGATTSASVSMKDPLYLAGLPEEVLRDAITNGIPGTPMPALSMAKGGILTDEQIDSLVEGIMAWKAGIPDQGPLPPYAAPLGDPAAGQATFGVYCASCHGATGTGTEKAGSVVQSAYLGLASDQYLRTVTVAGRPELGCPSYRDRKPGQPMSDTEIADVVAWLSSQRKPGPAEPAGLGERN